MPIKIIIDEFADMNIPGSLWDLYKQQKVYSFSSTQPTVRITCCGCQEEVLETNVSYKETPYNGNKHVASSSVTVTIPKGWTFIHDYEEFMCSKCSTKYDLVLRTLKCTTHTPPVIMNQPWYGDEVSG
jgi:hypothetical protein